MNKNETRVRRTRQTRIRIAEQLAHRLTIYRSNQHIFAQLYGPCGTKVIASASTMEADIKKALNGNGGNSAAAQQIGKTIAERAIKAGVTEVAFDRAGFRYHGRVKALAEAAREAGLKF